MKMVVTGISKEAAKELIDRLYGACMWGIEDRGITCYPTGEIEVVLTSESREDQFSGNSGESDAGR